MKRIDYSIVIPVYCNEGSLERTLNILIDEVINQNKLTWEIIFIDDGSTDSSFDKLLELKSKHLNMKVVKFTRNFGQISAIMAGYEHSSGDCVISLSADLQDPPKLINEMIKYHFDNHYDIVICSREARDESFIRRITSKLFYTTVKKLSFPNMPPGGFDFVLISKMVKKIILSENDSNPFWQGQILWSGHKVKFIPYKRIKRDFGNSKWTISKKIKYLIDGVLSYSYFPLRLMSCVGIMTSILGFFYATYIFFARIFDKIPIEGWAPLMIVILIVSGLQMTMLGIIGEYLWRTLEQVRNRKRYVIEKVYDNHQG